MLKEKVKKLFKDLLCASMLLTGFILNPVKANAEEEVGTYANPVQMWTETDSFVLDLRSGGTLNFYPKFRYTKSQTDTMMEFAGSATCTTIESGGTCVFKGYTYPVSNGDYCSLNSTNYLVINFLFETTIDGVKYDSVYRMRFYKNNLNQSYLVSVTKK